MIKEVRNSGPYKGARTMTPPPRPGQPNAPVEHSGTVLETDEDIRQVLLSGVKQRQNISTEPRSAPAAPIDVGRPASPYRPMLRPPVPILVVCDDGRPDGEVIRIRDQRFVIGRTEGDLRFPLDGRMSSRHVEITHQL